MADRFVLTYDGRHDARSDASTAGHSFNDGGLRHVRIADAEAARGVRARHSVDAEIPARLGSHAQPLDRFDFEHPVEWRVGFVAEVDEAEHLEACDAKVDDVADLDLHGVGGVSKLCAVGEVDAVAEHRLRVSAASRRVPYSLGALL